MDLFSAHIEKGETVVITSREKMRAIIDGINSMFPVAPTANDVDRLLERGKELTQSIHEIQAPKPAAFDVVDHRPPIRRIEIGSAPADRRRESEITEAMSGVGPTERDRIWKLVVQASQDGVGTMEGEQSK